MNARRIAVIGGGVYAARLVELIGRDPHLQGVEVCLGARRWSRLQKVCQHAAERLREIGSGVQVLAEPTLDRCVEGADVVILMIRVGGFDARAHDEAFPEDFGLAGDEGLGAGGFANGWRTVPVLRSMAETIRTKAPRSVVLNLVAPLGLATRMLVDQGLNCYGLCELPVTTRQAMLGAAGLAEDPSASGPGPLSYVGLNHLGFFWPRTDDGRRALEASLEAGLVDAAAVERFSAAPLHYYAKVFSSQGVSEPDGSAKAEASQCSGDEAPLGRSRQLEDLSERVLEQFSENPGGPVEELAERPTPWLELAVLPVLRAHLAGTREPGVGNCLNRGPLLPFLPPDAIVELAGIWGPEGFEPWVPADPPAAVVRFLQRIEAAESLAYQAIAGGRPEGLKKALRHLPLPLPLERMGELITEICRPIPIPAAEPATAGTATGESPPCN